MALPGTTGSTVTDRTAVLLFMAEDLQLRDHRDAVLDDGKPEHRNRHPGKPGSDNNGTIEKYCYNNVSANCDVYGGLYQWAEVVQYLNGATNTNSCTRCQWGLYRGFVLQDGICLSTENGAVLQPILAEAALREGK